MKDKIMKKLLTDLLQLAESSQEYKDGKQWAVNAVATARFIIGKKRVG